MTRPDTHQHLPLRPVALAVLAALANGPAAGFQVLQHANAATPGHPILGPGTLYRIMRELRTAGWIRRTDPPTAQNPNPSEDPGTTDERRAYHELTPAGRAILTAEAARLRRTLDAAGLLHP